MFNAYHEPAEAATTDKGTLLQPTGGAGVGSHSVELPVEDRYEVARSSRILSSASITGGG